MCRSNRQRLTVLLVACTTALVIGALPARAFDDLHTWSSLSANYLRKERLTLSFGAELRLDDDSTSLWFARASQQTRYRASDVWNLDANLSVVRVRAGGEFDLDALRLELAATPQWKLGERGGFDLRNRLDFWWRSGSAEDDVIYRLRPRFTIRLGDATGRRSVFFGDEVFLSESQERVFQNRFFPFGWASPVSTKARVELYVMLLSVHVGSDWRHDLVLGQNWVF